LTIPSQFDNNSSGVTGRDTRALPCTEVFDYYEPDEGRNMEFRLTYEGPLRAEEYKREDRAGRAKDKHELRKHFHLQLRELWKEHPDLRNMAETSFVVSTTPWNLAEHPGPNVKQINPVLSRDIYAQLRAPYPPDAKTWVERIADDHQRCGGRFVPLVNKSSGYTCSLDIIFLRRDTPGGIISSWGGDIDNRIKVLFDGLRMPETIAELGGLPIEADENPFFCLLEDDKLVTSITVTTDRLITPLKSPSKVHDVVLVIHVTIVDPSDIFSANRLV
jgi:hypothetical protein